MTTPTPPISERVSGQTEQQVERLQRVLDKITNEPRHHDQRVWFTLAPHEEGNEHHSTLPDLLSRMECLHPAGEDGWEIYGAKIAAADYLEFNGRTTWDCGTAGCLAGHAVLGEPDLARGATILISEDGDAEWMSDQNGHWFLIPIKAAELLGLNLYQREVMFAGTRTLVDLWVLAEVVSGGRITIPLDRVIGNPALLGLDDDMFDVHDVRTAQARWARESRLLPHPREIVYRSRA